MPADPPPQFAPGANYQRFAAAVVGLAVLVAIGASDQDAGATARQPAALVDALPPAAGKAPAARAEHALADEPEITPSQFDDDALAGQDDALAGQDDALAGQADALAGQAEPAPGTAALADAPPPPIPAAPELNQLAASSQARSEGIVPGDAPQLAPPPG